MTQEQIEQKIAEEIARNDALFAPLIARDKGGPADIRLFDARSWAKQTPEGKREWVRRNLYHPVGIRTLEHR